MENIYSNADPKTRSRACFRKKGAEDVATRVRREKEGADEVRLFRKGTSARGLPLLLQQDTTVTVKRKNLLRCIGAGILESFLDQKQGGER